MARNKARLMPVVQSIAVCQTTQAKPRQLKSSPKRRIRQAQAHDNGYSQLDKDLIGGSGKRKRQPGKRQSNPHCSISSNQLSNQGVEDSPRPPFFLRHRTKQAIVQ